LKVIKLKLNIRPLSIPQKRQILAQKGKFNNRGAREKTAFNH